MHKITVEIRNNLILTFIFSDPPFGFTVPVFIFWPTVFKKIQGGKNIHVM